VHSHLNSRFYPINTTLKEHIAALQEANEEKKAPKLTMIHSPPSSANNNFGGVPCLVSSKTSDKFAKRDDHLYFVCVLDACGTLSKYKLHLTADKSHPRTLTAEINEGLEWVICRKTTDKPVEFKPGRPRRTSSEPKKEGPGRDKNQRWVTHLEVQSFKLVSSPFWLGPQFKIVAYTEIPEHFPTDPRERIPIYEALPTKEIATSPHNSVEDTVERKGEIKNALQRRKEDAELDEPEWVEPEQPVNDDAHDLIKPEKKPKNKQKIYSDSQSFRNPPKGKVSQKKKLNPKKEQEKDEDMTKSFLLRDALA